MKRVMFWFALALVSAPAIAKHVYPRSLTPVAAGPSYMLKEDYAVSEKAATFTLAAGTYTVRYEDRAALYLIGGPSCVEMSVVPPKNPAAAWKDRWDCGIYLPKDPQLGATLFFIRKTPDKPSSGNGALVDGIIHAGYGSFDFPMSNKNDQALRARLAAPQA